MKGAILAGASLALSLAAPAAFDLPLPTVAPEKVLRFPGSGATQFATDGRILYGGSSWTREKGAVVFDVSDPRNMRFTSDLPARGYTTADPVIVGDFVYQPLWYGAMRVNVKDPSRPVVTDLVDFDWPKHAAESIVREGNELVFRTKKNGDRRHDVSGDLKDATPFARDPSVEFEYNRKRSSFRSFRRHGKMKEILCERFILHSLSSIAVVGDTAYIGAATQPLTTGLWTLDLMKDGFVDFGTNALFRPAPPPGTQGFTMLMQSVGAVMALGGGFLLADDGAVRLGPDRTMEYLGARERPVCNYGIDGKRIAAAESDRVRLLDVSDPAHVTECARIVFDIAWHATGVALAGDTLWVVTDEKSEAKRTHRNAFLGYVPPKSTLRRLRVSGTNLVEEATLDVPTSVAVVPLRDGLLCLSGMKGLTVVDGRAMKVVTERTDLTEGASYRIKRFGDRVFFTDARVGVKELDWTDPAHPAVRRVWRRSGGDDPAVDDFTVANGRLYALSHSSLCVYPLDGTAVPYRRTAPRFGLNFGATERGVARLPDGYEAVAFGEGGLYFRKDGRYVAELPPKADGSLPIRAGAVEADGTRLTVTDLETGEKVPFESRQFLK